MDFINLVTFSTLSQFEDNSISVKQYMTHARPWFSDKIFTAANLLRFALLYPEFCRFLYGHFCNGLLRSYFLHFPKKFPTVYIFDAHVL